MEEKAKKSICPIIFHNVNGVKEEQEKQEELGFSFDKLIEGKDKVSSITELELPDPFGTQGYCDCGGEVTCSIVPYEQQIRESISFSDEGRYAYETAIGRAYGKAVEMVVKEKVKENTQLTNRMTNVGFLRGKRFADGSMTYNVIAEARVVNGKKWIINGQIFFKLIIQNLSNKKTLETPVFCISEFDDDRNVEKIMARYFCPAETRAYLPVSIKDLKSRIFEFLDELSEEELSTTVGWEKGTVNHFLDGKEYPLRQSPIAILRAPTYVMNMNVNKIICDICLGLEKFDNEYRIRFLMGYGLTAWLASLCINSKVQFPRILLTGEQSVCREFAECFVKIYRREGGNDLITLCDVQERWLIEYIDIMRDDCIVLDAFETEKKKRLLKALIASEGLQNHKMEAPCVILQGFPNDDIEYTEYVVVDLLGYERAKNLLPLVDELKAILLEILEGGKIGSLNDVGSREVYEFAFEKVVKLIEILLVQAGGDERLVLKFCYELRKGLRFVKNYDAGTVELNVFQQRIRALIDTGRLKVVDFESVESKDEEMVVLRRKEVVYISVKCMNNFVLPMMRINASQYKRVRKALIVSGILCLYDAGNDYTKRITLPSGRRIHAFEMKSEIIENENV